MSLLKTIKAQLGLSNTPANNFTITAEADNGTLKLARGNAGATTQDILTVDANGVVTSVQGSRGGLFSGTAQNTTSGTSIDFTGIPSWAKRITVMFQGVSLSGTAFPRVQLGTSNGIEATGYGSLTTTATGAVSTSSSTTGFDISAGGANSTYHGSIMFSLLNSNIWTCSGVLMDVANARANYIGGSKTVSAVLDKLRLTSTNGTDTFDAGSVNIMYEG